MIKQKFRSLNKFSFQPVLTYEVTKIIKDLKNNNLPAKKFQKQS